MRIAAIVALLTSYICGQAQMYDAQWALGFDESVVDFRTDGVVNTDSLPKVQYFLSTNANICDSIGVLLFYTNGVSVCGIADTLFNGSGLSPCLSTTQDSLNGLDIQQAVIFIPMPGNSRYYYLFHFSNDTFQGVRPSKLYFSLIDREGNNGLGSLIDKNVLLLTGQVLREGGMTACKHANGRDYWLVMGASVMNRFYKFLITPEGVNGPFMQDIGPKFPGPYDIAYSKFSLDGSKYATGIFANAPILVMDFDRCTGLFSNPDTIFNHIHNDTANVSGSASLEFSPNNRFLYTSFQGLLTQYDLQSANIYDTSILYEAGNNEFYGIDMLQLVEKNECFDKLV